MKDQAKRDSLFPREDPHEWASRMEAAILVVFVIAVFAAAGPAGDILKRIFPSIYN